MRWTDRDLEMALTFLGVDIDWPDGPDLSPRVLNQITRATSPRRWLALVAAAVAVILLPLTPPGQQAVAWLLDIAGIRVELVGSGGPRQPPTTLVGGTGVSESEAEVTVGFDLKRPIDLPPPDSVQLVSWGGGQQVAMIWNESEELPEVFETGVGLLLIQFEARVDEQLLLKAASQETLIEPVEVNGVRGYFFSRAPHTVYFESPDRLIASDTIRLAGNVLIWMSDGVTYRMESDLGRERSIELAESLD